MSGPRAGLEVARQLGRKGGRKRQMTDSKIKSAKKLLATGVPPRDVATNLGVSVPTLYRWIQLPRSLSVLCYRFLCPEVPRYMGFARLEQNKATERRLNGALRRSKGVLGQALVSGLKKREQVAVDLVRKSRTHAVRASRNYL